MSLDKQILSTIKRTKSFYKATTPGHFLMNVHLPSNPVERPPLNQLNLDHDLEKWLNYQLQAARIIWEAKNGLEDDSIPSICPRFGIAEHSAWLGAEVMLQEDTCLPIPLLDQLENFDLLKVSEDAVWFQYMKTGYQYLNNQKDGTFVLSNRGTMTPMDIANAIRGDALFTDFLLEPELTHKLMTFLTSAINWYYDKLNSWADTIKGGQVYFLSGGWMEESTIGHLSNDTAMLCSHNIYREFGYPYEIQLTNNFDQIFYHVHNEKIHYLPSLLNLPNLSLLEISNDPKTVPPVEDLQRLLKITGDKKLMLLATSEQVKKNIQYLKECNVFLQVQCTDYKEAENIIDFIRQESKPI